MNRHRLTTRIALLTVCVMVTQTTLAGVRSCCRQASTQTSAAANAEPQASCCNTHAANQANLFASAESTVHCTDGKCGECVCCDLPPILPIPSDESFNAKRDQSDDGTPASAVRSFSNSRTVTSRRSPWPPTVTHPQQRLSLLCVWRI